MSILSQIGVALLILVIVFILVRSNRQLEEAAREGEHFVDEWAIKEIRKQELEKARKQLPDRRKTSGQDRPNPVQGPERTETFQEQEGTEVLQEQVFRKDPTPAVRMVDTGISLVELDDAGNPVSRTRVQKLPFTIGRAPENDLVIDDLRAARKHCMIQQKGQSFVLEDEGSRNQVEINGSRQEETVLADQLLLSIAGREFLVVMTSKGAQS